jgi:tetratricopeptide (TPR) repeat protein
VAPSKYRLELGESAPGVQLEPIADEMAAVAWFDAEDEVLRGLIRLEPGLPELDARIWQLGWCMTGFIVDRYRGQDRSETRSAAIAATERVGGVFGRLASRGHLSGPMLLVSTETSLAEELSQAMSAAAQDRNPGARAIVSYALTVGSGAEDRDAEALGYARQGREYFNEHGNVYWANRMQYAIGWHSARLGDFDEARQCFERLPVAAPPERKPLARANGNVGLGYIAHAEGRFDAAIGHFSESVAWFEANDLPASAAYAREHLGDTRREMGDRAAARSEWKAAAAVYEALGIVPETERVRAKIAAVDDRQPHHR